MSSILYEILDLIILLYMQAYKHVGGGQRFSVLLLSNWVKKLAKMLSY